MESLFSGKVRAGFGTLGFVTRKLVWVTLGLKWSYRYHDSLLYLFDLL
jgi:hypothetical protein